MSDSPNVDSRRATSEIFWIREKQQIMSLESERIQALLAAKLPYAEILEVGSSAVMGAIGKEDIDFAVLVPLRLFLDAKQELDGILERDEFQLCNDKYQGYKVKSPWEISVQLTVQGGEYDVFGLFMDALRRDQRLLDNYNALKRKFHGRPMYEYRVEKSKFIESVLLNANQDGSDQSIHAS
jgi:GrpB-like predicted nucleotidyltransferase (UPF0157 family)